MLVSGVASHPAQFPFLRQRLRRSFPVPVPVHRRRRAVRDLIRLKVCAYDTMIDWSDRDRRPAGLEEVMLVEGRVFLSVRAVYDVPRSDDLSRLSISSSDVRLILPDGTGDEPFGR